MHATKPRLGHKIAVACALITIVSFIALFAKSLTLDPKKVPSPLVGQNAKSFHVKMLQGADLVMKHPSDTLELQDLLGSPVVLNFWASWCGSCAEEAKIFEEFWEAHKNEGIKVLGVAVHDQAAAVMDFVKYVGKTYAIALDEEGRAALNYGVTGVPETVFIDRSGLVVHKESGPVTRPMLEAMLAKLTGKST